jgi:hypothetical protein
MLEKCSDFVASMSSACWTFVSYVQREKQNNGDREKHRRTYLDFMKVHRL